MTKSEFKAWFDGFCEGMDGVPNEKQWERIKARVAEIDDTPVTYPVFVDRYVDPIRRYWPNVPYWSASGLSSSLDAKSSVSFNIPDSRIEYQKANSPKQFDGLLAMNYAGRAEYTAILNS
jgi:hypothetical protein